MDGNDHFRFSNIAGCLAGIVFFFGLSSLPSRAQDTYVEHGSIKGKVHIVFDGFDLPLKSVPVYLLTKSQSFSRQLDALKQEISPLLVKKASLDAILASWNGDASTETEKRKEWIEVSTRIIDIEKKRVVLFRNNVTRTVYADEQGLFAFYDVAPDQYVVIVEGAIRDRATIWKENITLDAGGNASMDFGEHNVGDTREIYR